jgi:hypothetical protein
MDGPGSTIVMEVNGHRTTNTGLNEGVQSGTRLG